MTFLLSCLGDNVDLPSLGRRNNITDISFWVNISRKPHCEGAPFSDSVLTPDISGVVHGFGPFDFTHSLSLHF